MLFDVAHQEADGQQADHKGHHHADEHYADLQAGEGVAGQQILDQLQAAGARHDRNGQVEGKLGGHGAAQAQQQAAHDGGAAAAGAGNQAQHLPQAHHQGVLPGQLVHMGYRGAAAVVHHQEQHAVKNQRGSHHGGVVQVRIQPVVQRKADDRGGHTGDEDQPPKPPDVRPQPGNQLLAQVCALGGRLVGLAEGPQLIKIQQHHGQNGAQLDDHPEHTHKRLAQLELNNLLQQDHVAGAGDGQPFGNALYDAHEHRL